MHSRIAISKPGVASLEGQILRSKAIRPKYWMTRRAVALSSASHAISPRDVYLSHLRAVLVGGELHSTIHLFHPPAYIHAPAWS